MMSPVALSFADDVLERDELIARLHTFSPLVAHWQELPHVFWVETAGEPIKGLSTAAFIRRLITELRRAGYLPSAVWGCAPYAAALLAQRLPVTHTLHLDRRQQNGALSGLPIAALNLEEATVKSLERLGVTHLRSLGKVSQDDLEARYGAPLKIRLRLLAGANPPWRIATPPPSCSRTLLIEHALTRCEALLFVIAAPLEEALEELASQGLACRAMLISCACDDGERIRYAVRPARPSLDAQWLVELLRLKLENSALHSAIISADLELQSAPADAQQLHLFEIGRRDQRQSDEALDRIRAELGEDCLFIAQACAEHHPQEGTNWQRHDSGWPTVQPLKPRPSWVRRQLQTPQALAPPPPAGAWSVLGKRVLEIGGPFPLLQRWWSSERREEEYLLKVDSGEVFWVLHDPQAGSWSLIGWVA